MQRGVNELLVEHGLLPATDDEADASSTQSGEEVDEAADGEASTDTSNATEETMDPEAEPVDPTAEPTSTEEDVGSTPDGTDPTTSETGTAP